MRSQRELGDAFERGATSGTASSVEIREACGGYALVDTRGAGAVYAYRYPSGNIVAFEGWYGFSPSTSTMMTKLGVSPTCRHDEDRVYRANTTSAEAPTVYEHRARVSLSDWLDESDPTAIGQPKVVERAEQG